jgi:hypothetical protein
LYEAYNGLWATTHSLIDTGDSTLYPPQGFYVSLLWHKIVVAHVQSCTEILTLSAEYHHSNIIAFAKSSEYIDKRVNEFSI